jgi:hypothetical protein
MDLHPARLAEAFATIESGIPYVERDIDVRSTLGYTSIARHPRLIAKKATLLTWSLREHFRPRVTVIPRAFLDMGNLYSIERACVHTAQLGEAPRQ